MRLPAAFRSWPRPSSAFGALASTLCSSSLDFLILRPTFRSMKYLLPTLTGLRLSFLPYAVVKMRRRVFRASQVSPFGDPENDTGSVLRTTCPSRRVSPVSAVSPACPFCLSADRPRFEGLPFGFALLPRKEVIQPHLPIRLPCYDFTPVIDLTLGCWLLAVTCTRPGNVFTAAC